MRFSELLEVRLDGLEGTFASSLEEVDQWVQEGRSRIEILRALRALTGRDMRDLKKVYELVVSS